MGWKWDWGGVGVESGVEVCVGVGVEWVGVCVWRRGG